MIPAAPRLRWGVLSTGNIAGKFVRDLRLAGMEISAVASRSTGRAEAFAREFGLARAHGSYENLLADPGVDAVYLALPNHLHAEWTIRCAAAGKHVLCEKPAALTEPEGARALEAVRRAGTFFMEGFMYRLHPLWKGVESILHSGRIGEIRLLHASFCYDMGLKPDNIRQCRELGGGALNDVGCYCLSFFRMITREEPAVLCATARLGPQSGVDEWMAGSLAFPSGVLASFHCALRLAEPHQAIIYGEKGRIEIPSPWHPHKDAAKVHVHDGRGEEVLRFGDGLPLFAREALRVAECLEGRQCPELSWENTLGQARALERLREAMAFLPDASAA